MVVWGVGVVGAKHMLSSSHHSSQLTTVSSLHTANQPYWLNTTLENNVDYARRYKHQLDLKWLDAPEFLFWQKEACAVPTTDTLKCNTNVRNTLVCVVCADVCVCGGNGRTLVCVCR
jgi:hypothetical protein